MEGRARGAAERGADRDRFRSRRVDPGELLYGEGLHRGAQGARRERAARREATPEELDEYRKFIVGLANRVAEAHKGITDTERSAIAEIESALAA
jgi:hypothetical protein